MSSQQNTNKHSLSRNIPSDIKRIVRKKCGFGCIICGEAIIRYHHFNPPFEDAIFHDPDKITLVCPTCHSYFHNNIWSEEKLYEAVNNPKCLQTGFSYGLFDLDNPDIIFGETKIMGASIIIQVEETPILQIHPPEEKDGPFRVSGIFCDEEGNEILRIVKNEWQGPIENWDLETEKNKLTIRFKKRLIALKLISEPPNKLIIERINMFYSGVKITTDVNGTFKLQIGEKGVKLISHGAKLVCKTPLIAFKITSGRLEVGVRPLRFKCEKCGNCCKSKENLIILTYHDILSLKENLKLDLSELEAIIRFHVWEKEAKYSSHIVGIIRILSREGASSICIMKNDNGHCFFFNEKNNQCKIYSIRPLYCKIFPFLFVLKLGLNGLAVKFCKGIGESAPLIDNDNYINLIDQLKNSDEYISTWNKKNEELSYYDFFLSILRDVEK